MSKTITGSVGQGGINASKDTMTVQYLLNCVPKAKGGPMTELAVDGLVGPKTIAAIKGFQKANCPTSDGRVDPGKLTFKALQRYDPQPGLPLNPGGYQKRPPSQDAKLPSKFAGQPGAGKTAPGQVASKTAPPGWSKSPPGGAPGKAGGGFGWKTPTKF